MQPTGICYQAYIPMRSEPSSTSEMVNQVLFGESFVVLEENKVRNFSRISLHHDSYEGWINSDCIHYPSQTEWMVIKNQNFCVSHELMNLLHSENNQKPLLIGCGSILRFSSPGKTNTPDGEYTIPEIASTESLKKSENLVSYGMKMLSVPYLWGGRSSFGFDCSGLCQNLYRQVGIDIPRDAALQSALGHTLNFIAEAKAGDLAFFDNEDGKITHVGMILGDGKILHASGKVKIDEIDHQGIFSRELNRYTHKLRLIRKLVD
jgi:cell wall-associated NlpC family hydrolase